MLQYPDAINSVVVEQIDEKAEGPCVLDRDNIRVVAKRSPDIYFLVMDGQSQGRIVITGVYMWGGK